MRPRSSGLRNRTLALLVVAGAVAAPAGVLRVMCVGRSCSSSAAVEADAPFCSLPSRLRTLISAGYREGRSPDVFAVVAKRGVSGAAGATPASSWPSLDRVGARVPVLFQGTGVAPDAAIPAGATLDQIAPTIAEVIGLERPHPGVRSGQAIDGVADDTRPALVLEIVLTNVDSDDVRGGEWPELEALLATGSGTLDARVGSEPLDPAASLTTIGTGGLPRQHGITGASLRSNDGALVRAWGPGAPVSVISTLADDLDELRGQRPLIGLVGTSHTDRGAIGGNWYVRNDRDDMVFSKEDKPMQLLQQGYGRDATPDLLVTTLAGDHRVMDTQIGELVRSARVAARGSLLTVVTATGNPSAPPSAVPTGYVRGQLQSTLGVDVVEGFAPGGLFVDQALLAREHISEDDVEKALRGIRRPDGARLFADVFPGIAISFARYC